MWRSYHSIQEQAGDKQHLKNYRPLSLINVDYYGNLDGETTRLARALSPEIGTHQSAFLGDRLIDENIQFVIARSKIRNENLGVLFLDQEKAYDRVSHDFMWEVFNGGIRPAQRLHYMDQNALQGGDDKSLMLMAIEGETSR
jgi:hypothetical protein